MEDTRNIGAICAVCSEERRLSWQQHHTSLVLEVGDFVKIRFRMNDSDDEWMWVEIADSHISSEGKGMIYQGILRNDSIFNPDFSYGKPLGFYRSDIADYCKQGDFDSYDPWIPTPDGTLHERHE